MTWSIGNSPPNRARIFVRIALHGLDARRKRAPKHFGRPDDAAKCGSRLGVLAIVDLGRGARELQLNDLVQIFRLPAGALADQMDGSFRGAKRRVDEIERRTVARHLLGALRDDLVAVVSQFLDQADVVIEHVARGFSDIDSASVRRRFRLSERRSAQLLRPAAQERAKFVEHWPVQVFDRPAANEELLDLTQARTIYMLVETVALGVLQSLRPFLQFDVVLGNDHNAFVDFFAATIPAFSKIGEFFRQYSLAIQFPERITSSNADLSVLQLNFWARTARRGRYS